MHLPFQDDICTILEITKLPGAEREAVLEEVERNIRAHVLLAIMSRLTPEAQEDFEQHYLAGREEEADTIASTCIPDIDEFVSRESHAALDELKRQASE